MTVYSITLFLHLISALALFIGLGLEWTSSALLRRAANAEQARSWLRVYRVSSPVSGPALLLLILSGGYLANLIGVMKQGWIPATFIAIAVVVVLGFAINVPQLGKIRTTLPAGNEELSPELRRRLRSGLLATSVRLRISIAAGIVFLMAAKLPFGPAMVALGCATIFGLLISIPAWRAKSA